MFLTLPKLFYLGLTLGLVLLLYGVIEVLIGYVADCRAESGLQRLTETGDKLRNAHVRKSMYRLSRK